MLRALYRILLDPAAGEGGGTEGGTTKTDPPAVDPSEGFRAALKKHGDDATAFARQLYLDHQATRSELDATRKSTPKEGSLVLDPDAAKGWADLVTKHKPEAIAQALADLETANGKIAAVERKELIQAASKAVGSDLKPLDFDPDVLTTLLGDLKLDLKDGKDRMGKPAKTAEVVEISTDANGKEVETRTPLDKYATAKWTKFLPSLKASHSGPANPSRPSNVPPTTAPGLAAKSALRVPRV